MEDNSSEIMSLPTAETDGVFSGYKELSRHGVFVLGTVCWHGHVWFVKSLCAELGQSSEARMLLLKEYEILLSFNHPGIVRVVALKGIPGVGLSMLMEHVSGVHLDEYLHEAGRSRRALLARLLLEAMAYVHSKGVAHLDLKPENILVSGAADNPRVTVIDFNLSDAAQYSRGKTVGGNRAYSAPEQWEAGYVASPRADVWSLGKLLQEIRPGLAWRPIVRRAMIPEPEKRFADASAMLAARRRTGFVLRCAGLFAAAGALIFTAIAVVPPLIAPPPEPVTVVRTDTLWRERKPDSVPVVKTAGDVAALPETSTLPQGAPGEEKWIRLHNKGVDAAVRQIESRTKKFQALLEDDTMSKEELRDRCNELVQQPLMPQVIIRDYLRECPEDVLKKHETWGTGMEMEVQQAMTLYVDAMTAVGKKIGKMYDEAAGKIN